MPQITDIGVNLADKSFDADRDAVVAAAVAAGVTRMVITGSCANSNLMARDLADKQPDIFWATAGLHPHHAEQYDSELEQNIEHCLTSPQVRAVGECGLDYFRDIAPRAQQIAAFEAQLAIAARAQMPVFLHQREAIDDFVAIVGEHRDRWPRGVAHCFTDDREALRRLLDLNLFIGITGWICDERRGQHLLDLVRYVPPDRLMIETDAPYLLPRSLRPKPKTRRNEPRWLPEVLKTIATALGRPPEEIADQTRKNAETFFARN